MSITEEPRWQKQQLKSTNCNSQVVKFPNLTRALSHVSRLAKLMQLVSFSYQPPQYKETQILSSSFTYNYYYYYVLKVDATSYTPFCNKYDHLLHRKVLNTWWIKLTIRNHETTIFTKNSRNQTAPEKLYPKEMCIILRRKMREYWWHGKASSEHIYATPSMDPKNRLPRCYQFYLSKVKTTHERFF